MPRTPANAQGPRCGLTGMMTLRVILCTLLLGCGIRFANSAENSRPNIIIIFTDDQGFADLGCQGMRDDVRTPHIDRLAKRGIRMINGFVTAPQCMPSRVGILTGRYQQHSGIETNRTATKPNKAVSMTPNVETIASHLKRAGYTTGMSGKWGVGGGPSRMQRSPQVFDLPKRELSLLPAARGFDEYFSGTSHVYVASHQLDGIQINDSPTLITDDRYRVEVQSEAAVGFIRRHANDEQPFFLYYAPYSPHAPFEAPQHYLDQFDHIDNPKRRVCLAMMACVDDSVGRLIDVLRQHEIEDNTLIWYVSDNGAPGNGGGLNLPLGGGKGSLLDGGIRVPFIASWPGHLPEGVEYEPMVSTLDIFPTCLAVAGVKELPERLDGVDLLPFLGKRQNNPPHSHLFFRWTFRGVERAAIRSSDWKLLRSARQHRLFDLRNDPSERKDVAADHPDVTRDLSARLNEWLLTIPVAANPPKRLAQPRSSKSLSK
ncbi:MAG: sulfatase-like hydrolase/transferase [Planctomycetota bacterium]